MKRNLYVFLIILFIVFASINKGYGYGNDYNNDKGGHDTITKAAATLKSNIHSGDRDFDQWINKNIDPVNNETTLDYFRFGAHDEDSTLPGDPLYGPNTNAGGWFFHFYNPYTKLGLGGLMNFPGSMPYIPSGAVTSAPLKAEYYKFLAKKQLCAKGKFENLNPLEKQKTYDYLGRTMHLIQDMSSPSHVKGAFMRAQGIHGLFGPGGLLNPIFENYVANNWDAISSSDVYKNKVTENNYNENGYEMSVKLNTYTAMNNSAKNTYQYPDDLQLMKQIVGDPPCPECPPSITYEVDQEKLVETANELVPEAILRSAGFIDAIYKIVKNGGDCENEPPAPNPDHPDDNYDVSNPTKNTQFGMPAYEQLDFFTRLSLKKGNISPVYMRQIMEIYAEGKALPADATDEQKNAIDQKFITAVNKLYTQTAKDIETSPDIAILENGSYMQMTAIINKHKEPVRIVPVDFSPEIVEDHPVLVIPSGGLYGLEKSDVLKASLDEYVRQGGTLIVFSQQHGYEFSPLPVPQETDDTYRAIKGYGWVEDQSCFANSVCADTYHQILSGQSRATPSFNVDGYFTDYPSTSTVILRRTANAQPAMIMYEYGLGKVIVTSMYSDFSYGSSQASSEEIAFIRDLVSWAKKPAQLPEAKPGENITVPVSLANITDMGASQIKCQLYNPDRSQIISEQSVGTGLAAYSSTDITLQFSAPASLGIYHVDYVLLDAQGNIIQPRAEKDSGRFAVSNPPANPYKSSDFNFSATTATDRLPYGSDALFTLHIWNNTEQTRTVTAKYVFPHHRGADYGVFTGSFGPGFDGQWLSKTVTVNPHGNVNFDHVMKNAIHDEFIYANFYDENNKYLGSATAGFFVFHSSANVTLQTDKEAYVRGETVTVTAMANNTESYPFQGSIKFTIAAPDGTTLFEDAKSIAIPARATVSVNTSFTLPLSLSAGLYQVRADALQKDDRLSSAFTVFKIPQSEIVFTPHFPDSFKVGANILSFDLKNIGQILINAGNIAISLKDPDGQIAYSNSRAFTLGAGESKTLVDTMQITSLKWGEYVLSIIRSDETQKGIQTNVVISRRPTVVFALDKPAYKARDTVHLMIRLIYSGKLDLSNITANVGVPGIGFNDTQSVSLPTDGRDLILSYEIPVPETIAAGTYEVNITFTLPSGGAITGSTQFAIPKSSLVLGYSGSCTINAGDVVNLTLENTGGADTEYENGVFSITDANGLMLYEVPLTGTIMAGEKRNIIEIEFPTSTTSGDISLSAAVVNKKTLLESALKKTIAVNGVSATFHATTNKDSFKTGENAIVLLDIANGSYPIEEGTLQTIVAGTMGTGMFSHILPREGWISVSTQGFAFAPDGSFYVTDGSNNRVVRYDRNFKPLARWGNKGNGQGQFDGPTGIAVDYGGNVYVADPGNYRIERFNKDGVFTNQWGLYGSGAGEFSSSIQGVAVGPDGFIYVVDAGNSRVQRFKSDGTFVSQWGSYGSGNGQFNRPIGISISPDSSVYVVDEYNKNVQKFNSDGTFILAWGGEGSGNGQFYNPQGVAVDASGFVYVSDNGNNRIQKFTGDGFFIAQWGSYGEENGQFSSPGAIGVSADEHIFVAEQYGNNRIQKFTADGLFVAKWERYGVDPGEFSGPEGIEMAQNGSLFIVDGINNRIQKFDSSGNVVTVWGTTGNGNGQFKYPADIALDGDGNCYVADTGNNRVQKFSNDGTFILAWGSKGAGNGQFYYPQGVAAGPDEFVYIADSYNCRIQKFDRNGVFVKQWGSCGAGNGQFYNPTVIAVAADGYVYVGDRSRCSIQKFNDQGEFVAKWGSCDITGSITDITVGKDGYIYVVDAGYSGGTPSIQKFDSNGAFLGRWGTEGDGRGQFRGPCGITTGTDGSLYIADTENNRIEKLDVSSLADVGTIFDATTIINQGANITQQYSIDAGVLNTTGKFYVTAILANDMGQTIAQAAHPFYVVLGNVDVTYALDKAKYLPGDLVTITGEVKNPTPFSAAGISLVLEQNSKSERRDIFIANFDLAANESFPFTVTAKGYAEEIYTITARVLENDIVLAEKSDAFEVAIPKIYFDVTAPEIVGDGSFDVVVEIANDGNIEGTMDFTSEITGLQTVTIPAHGTKSFRYPQRISGNRIYDFTTHLPCYHNEIPTGEGEPIIRCTDLVKTEQVTLEVLYGLSAAISIDSATSYPEGKIAVPYSVSNAGLLDETVTITAALEPIGNSSQKVYFVPQGQAISDVLIYDLTEGDYMLTLTSQSPSASAQVSFSVRKEIKLEVTNPVITTNIEGRITVTTTITNHGYTDVMGKVKMSIIDSGNTTLWQTSQDITVPASQPPMPQQVVFFLSPEVMPAGNYTIVIEVIGGDGAVINSQSMPYTVQGEKIVLTQTPAPISVNPGEEATFVFKVTNTGGKDGLAVLTLKAYDLMNFTKQEWIAPGVTKEITISFLVPANLEEKDYFADYELKDKTATIAKGQVKYHLNGININVNASLEKASYSEGDTARLTLTVMPGTLPRAVGCFAKANYGDYEEKKDFSLSGAITLTFNVPLTRVTGDKLAFGIYHESGRSIYLNSLYIYKTGEIFTITTNKQVYNQGETGTMTITGSQTGMMTVSGPYSYSETFSFNGNATKNFTLPVTAAAGTCPIEARLTLATGEIISSTYPIDIAGMQVKIKEAVLDRGKYAPSDLMKLALKIESNTNTTASLKTWITYPDNTTKYIGEKAINLTAAEPIFVSGEYPLTTQISGIHKLVYGIYASNTFLVSGLEAFDVGDAVLLSIAADKPDYPLGTEPVTVKLGMYGTMAATLVLELDGVNIKSESVSLNGFSKTDIPLSNVPPGAHTLKAILTAGGLSSTKETGFVYGSSLADLVPDVWGLASSIGKDTFMKLSVSVTNRGQTTSTPTTLTFSDGDALLSTFSVPAMATGEIKAFEYSLQVMGKAGEHSFKAVINPANSVVEFNRENNTVTRKVVIPDIISFTDTPKDTYRTSEQVPITTTIINLTQTTFYPNLTILTVVKDATGVEVFRKSSPFSAPPSKSSLFNDIWMPANLAEGTYSITQTIVDGTATLAQSRKILTLLKGSGFTVSVSKDNFTMKQGETTSLTISIEPLAGWTGFVNLFVEGTPPGTSISFNPAEGLLPPGSVTMSISTTDVTPASNHTLTIIAEGSENGTSVLQSIPITLAVQGFSITAAPQSVIISQLGTATVTLTTSSFNGYEGTVSLSQQTSIPKGTIVSIDKTNMAVPDGTTVRIQTSKFTRPGNYAITIDVRDGLTAKRTDLLLTVTENLAIVPGFVLTPGPGYENQALVTLVSRNFTPVMELTAFSTKFGANAVMGDIDGDGEDEIIVAPGPDPRAEGKLKIYRKNGTFILEKKIFNNHFGLNLTVGDINGDLKEEIIVGTGPDLLFVPRVKVFSWSGSNLVDTGIDFTPYPKECIFCDIFQLGVHLAAADVDGDGILEIITGPGPSILNKARVKIFKLNISAGMGNWRADSTLSDFIVRDGNNNHFLFGINVAAGDTDGDASPEIIAGLGPYSPYAPTVKVYETNGTFTGVSFNAFSSIQGYSYQSGFGVYVAARDLDGDGFAEIITGTGPSPFNSSWVRVFKGDGSLLSNGFLAYPEQMHYGVKVSTGNIGE